MKKEKMLILGCSIGTEDALHYAKQVGIYTILTDYFPIEISTLKEEADEYWMIDVADLDTLEVRCRENEVKGIFAASSEFCLDKARELCKRLNLPFYASNEGWMSSRDKERFKQHCIDCDLDVPKRYDIETLFTESFHEEISWPVIVKPVDACAKKGVSVCYAEDELKNGIEYERHYSETGRIMVEEYIEGNEIGAVYLLNNGNIVNVNTVDFIHMPVNGSSSFTYTRHNSIYEGEYRCFLSEKIERLLKRMQCWNGVVSFQIMRKNGKYYFLEMGYRLNGGGSWIIDEKLCGINIVEYLVDFAMGHETDLWMEKRNRTLKYQAGGTYLLWARPGRIAVIEGVEEIRKEKDIRIIYQNFKAGDNVPETISLKQVAFYICLADKSEEGIRKKLELINKTLHMKDVDGKEMLLYFEDYGKRRKNAV